jgi:outer membrane protein TolC
MSERNRNRNRGLYAMAAMFTGLVGASVHAAEPEHASANAMEVSLADLLRSAVRKDPLGVAAARDVESAEAERKAMAGRRYPSLTSLMLAGPTPAARGDAVRSTTPVDDYGDLIESLGPFFRAELTVTQPLYTFGKITAAESALGKLVEVRRAQAETTRWEIVTQVKSAYYGLLFIDDLLGLTDEVQEYVDQAKKHLDERLKSDDAEVTPIDRAKLTVYEAELKTERIELVKKRAVLRDALVRLAAIEVQPGWRLAEKELSPVHVGPVDRAGLLDEALRSRPEIEAASAGVEALSAKREAMRAKYWPDVFLAGRVRYGVAPNRDRQTSPFANDDFNFLDAGIALGLRHEWPTGVNGPEVAKVSAEMGALEARRRALTEKVSHELIAAVDEWRAAADKIEATKDGFKAARAWSAFARNGFELGTVPAKDLIDAVSAFVKARVALLTMTHEHNVAVARLSRTAGRELLPELQAGIW